MAGSLREALEGAIEQHEAAVDAPVAPIDKVDAETIQQSETVGAASNTEAIADDKAKADRARDEQGRFAKEEKEKKDAAAKAAKATAQPAAKAPATSQAAAAPAQQPQGAAPAVDGTKYPTTWKKGLEQQWQALPPEVKAEIQRREGNYASGVSTYKTEWDRAKPLIDAIAPYKQILDQNNIKADQHVGTLLKIHHDIVTGTPQQKAAIMVNMMRGNGIQPEMLFVQGQDGKVYFNPNLAQAAPQQQAPQPQDIDRIVDEKLSIRESKNQIDQFLSQTDKYPHAKEVAPTMAQLLEANLADDLPSAYEAALRLPQHAHFYEADQQQVRATAEKAAAEAKQKQAAAARRNAVSVRSSTPTSVSTAPNGKKSLRDTIAENVDGVAAGRV